MNSSSSSSSSYHHSFSFASYQQSSFESYGQSSFESDSSDDEVAGDETYGQSSFESETTMTTTVAEPSPRRPISLSPQLSGSSSSLRSSPPPAPARDVIRFVSAHQPAPAVAGHLGTVVRPRRTVAVRRIYALPPGPPGKVISVTKAPWVSRVDDGEPLLHSGDRVLVARPNAYEPAARHPKMVLVPATSPPSSMSTGSDDGDNNNNNNNNNKGTRGGGAVGLRHAQHGPDERVIAVSSGQRKYQTACSVSELRGLPRESIARPVRLTDTGGTTSLELPSNYSAARTDMNSSSKTGSLAAQRDGGTGTSSSCVDQHQVCPPRIIIPRSFQGQTR